jgi:hypothetical protein
MEHVLKFSTRFVHVLGAKAARFALHERQAVAPVLEYVSTSHCTHADAPLWSW